MSLCYHVLYFLLPWEFTVSWGISDLVIWEFEQTTVEALLTQIGDDD